MLSRDFISTNGILKVHLSVMDDYCCYIYVLNCLDQKLTMRFFTNVKTATNWIHANISPGQFS